MSYLQVVGGEYLTLTNIQILDGACQLLVLRRNPFPKVYFQL